MRTKTIYLLAVGALCVSACSSDTQKAEKETTRPLEVREEVKPQMQQSIVTREAELNGKSYQFHISRKPDPSLPEVKLKNGSSFRDNCIELLVKQGDKEVFHRTFTKKDFRDVVSARFMEQSILEGLVYDRIEKGKFLFAASVCVPNTDLYVPARVLISPQGGIVIEKEDSMDDTLDDEVLQSGTESI